MKNLYKKYKKLKIDGSIIGLAAEDNSDYFCTPIGAEIIGWDNGIHYCFIEGFEDTVFCVNPETCCDYYVYPIAKNFNDFLGLILTVGSTNTLQQIIWWDKGMYDSFVNSPEEQQFRANPKLTAAINEISNELKIIPIDNPFEYVKALQHHFPYGQIRFSNDYYDTLGLERPDGTQAPENGFEFAAVEFRFGKN